MNNFITSSTASKKVNVLLERKTTEVFVGAEVLLSTAELFAIMESKEDDIVADAFRRMCRQILNAQKESNPDLKTMFEDDIATVGKIPLSHSDSI